MVSLHFYADDTLVGRGRERVLTWDSDIISMGEPLSVVITLRDLRHDSEEITFQPDGQPPRSLSIDWPRTSANQSRIMYFGISNAPNGYGYGSSDEDGGGDDDENIDGDGGGGGDDGGGDVDGGVVVVKRALQHPHTGPFSHLSFVSQHF